MTDVVLPAANFARLQARKCSVRSNCHHHRHSAREYERNLTFNAGHDYKRKVCICNGASQAVTFRSHLTRPVSEHKRAVGRSVPVFPDNLVTLDGTSATRRELPGIRCYSFSILDCSIYLYSYIHKSSSRRE